LKTTNFLAKKYLFSKTRFNIVFIISVFSITVLSISYFSFIVILSVFSGLENFSVEYSKSFDPEIKASSKDQNLIELSKDDLVFLSGLEDSVSKVLRGRVLVENDGKINFSEIIGVDKSFNDVINFSGQMVLGKYEFPHKFNSYTSYSLTNNLNLSLFSSSGAYSVYALNNVYPDVLFRPFKNEKVLFSSGIFKTRNDNNENIIVADINIVQNLFGYKDNVYSALYFTNNKKNGELKQKLIERFKNLKVQSYEEQNETLFKIINSERIVVSLIMIMIVIISAFNAFSSVIMLIIEKEKDIKTLSVLGLNKIKLQSVFFKNGLLLNIIGLFLGIFLGTAFVLLQKKFSIISVSELNIPYPAELTFVNYLIVISSALLVAVISSYVSSLAVKKL
jgi:lipoprotein-releasing system permease protein